MEIIALEFVFQWHPGIHDSCMLLCRLWRLICSCPDPEPRKSSISHIVNDIIILRLHLSVRLCVTYEWEVNGNDSTRAKKFSFSALLDLVHYKR
jgi:hypothetical protein